MDAPGSMTAFGFAKELIPAPRLELIPLNLDYSSTRCVIHILHIEYVQTLDLHVKLVEVGN